jgi:hypothetical protein
MSYANWGDVSGRYPEFTNVGGADIVNSHHIHGAEVALNGMLAGHFTVPFSSNNLTARDLTIDLTYIRYMRNKDPKRIEIMRKDFMDRIDRLRKGEDVMMTDSGDSLLKSGGEAIYSTTQTYHPTFDWDKPEYWFVDSSMIYDSRQDR